MTQLPTKYEEYLEEPNDEEFKEFPTFHFLDGLANHELFFTPDYKHYFLLLPYYDHDEHINKRLAHAAIKLNLLNNTYIDYEDWKRYGIHIDWLCASDELRGTGTLAVVTKLLIEQAEKSGIYLYGHSRPFNISMPNMTNHKEIEEWLKLDIGTHNSSFKRDKIQSKKLLKKYLDYGFCRYDGTGTQFQNRYWKKVCFGYRSSSLDNELVNTFLDEHLRC